MKLLELFKRDTSKFFAIGSVCRTYKSGIAYLENEQKIQIPSNTRVTIEGFNLYTNRVSILVDGRVRADITYEYLIDCISPINVSTQPIQAVQVLQRVNHIISNEAIVKLLCISLVFCAGLLLGVVFHS